MIEKLDKLHKIGLIKIITKNWLTNKIYRLALLVYHHKKINDLLSFQKTTTTLVMVCNVTQK